MSFPGQSVYNLMKELHILCSLSLDHYERTRKLNILKKQAEFLLRDYFYQSTIEEIFSFILKTM